MKKRKEEQLATSAAEQAVPVEVLDVIPGEQPTYAGWNDPAIDEAQLGWPEKTGTRQCAVALTAEEIVAVSDAKLAVEDELEDAEASASAAKARWKSVIEEKSGEAKRLRTILKDKKEQRDVPTRWIFGFRPGSGGVPIPDPNCKTLIRTDTGEPVTHDAISSDDRQPDLFPED